MIVAILIVVLIVILIAILIMMSIGLLRTMGKKDPKDKQSVLDRKDK